MIERKNLLQQKDSLPTQKSRSLPIVIGELINRFEIKYGHEQMQYEQEFQSSDQLVDTGYPTDLQLTFQQILYKHKLIKRKKKDKQRQDG